MTAPLLLALALASPASAAKLPDCIRLSTSAARVRWMPDLDAVRACHEKAREKLLDAAAAKGKPLSEAALEELDEQQRAQVREYLAKSGAVIEGSPKKEPGLGGVAKKDLQRVSPKDGEDISGLEKRLHAAAGEGKDGITPAMGRDLIDSLTRKQGFVSPDMKELIESVVRDGGKLTPETMKKLQGAGREAKSAGLDLNIDEGTEKNLLEHDFDKDGGPKAAPHADPGNL